MNSSTLTYTIGQCTDDEITKHIDVSMCEVEFTVPDIGQFVIRCPDGVALIIDHAKHDLSFAMRGSKKDMAINDEDPSLMTITSTYRIKSTIHTAMGTTVHITTRPKAFNPDV